MSRRSTSSLSSDSNLSLASTLASASRSTCASVSDARPLPSSSSILTRAAQARLQLESSSEYTRAAPAISTESVAVRESARRAFAHSSNIWHEGSRRMDSHAFAGLCDACGFVDEKLSTHVNLIFARVTRPGFVMDVAQLASALDLIAKRKGCAVDEVHAALDRVTDSLPEPDLPLDFSFQPPEESASTLELIEGALNSGDVVLLKGRWLMELSKSGKALPRRQDLPEASVWSPSPLMKTVKDYHSRPKSQGTVMVAITCFWESVRHPDPEGVQLRALCKRIEQRLINSTLSNSGANRASLDDIAIFWDYASCPQQEKPSRDQKVSREEIDSCLSRRAVWYTHPKVEVWIITEDSPGVFTCAKSCTA